jgi:CRP/FNR family cyclic AMP-dependent transcriptional regulator
VFGEMALLDAEPRIASVTAVEPARLLRLDQGPFYELIVDRPEVAIGLIRVLTGRLRATVRDLTELNAMMAAPPNTAQNW